MSIEGPSMQIIDDKLRRLLSRHSGDDPSSKHVIEPGDGRGIVSSIPGGAGLPKLGLRYRAKSRL